MNIGSLFSRHARYRPNHTAVVFDTRRLTYLEFNREINRLANTLLALGVTKGDKVATLLPNCLELLEVYCASAKIGAVVVPLPFLEMRIMDPEGNCLPPREIGEICGRGPILTPGYYKRPDLTRQAIPDGWLRSGDPGYVDEDGFLYLVDRVEDLIISGGVNVYPRDIEEVVVQHPDVREAAVFGVAHERWGETPVAAVVLQQAEAVRADTLRQWINAHVAAQFQRVSDVMILEEFPRNVAGKILKHDMRLKYTASINSGGVPSDQPITSREVES